jgi:hypothetical protein
MKSSAIQTLTHNQKYKYSMARYSMHTVVE